MTDNDLHTRGETIARDMWGQAPQGNEVSRPVDITVGHLFGWVVVPSPYNGR